MERIGNFLCLKCMQYKGLRMTHRLPRQLFPQGCQTQPGTLFFFASPNFPHHNSALLNHENRKMIFLSLSCGIFESILQV